MQRDNVNFDVDGIDVYGLGNALLDLEFNITPEFIHTHRLVKGGMTLVSQEQQQSLITDLGLKNVVKIASGGSAANTLATLQLLGGKGFFSCKISDDEFGTQYWNELTAIGLASNFSFQPRPFGMTGSCLAMITADGDRTMNTHLGISESFSVSELYLPAIKAAKYLYIEGYLLSSDTALDAVIEAKAIAEKAGVKIALTLSDTFFLSLFKTRFQEILMGGIDLLFCNESEALEFTGTHLLDAAKTALKSVAKQFVITRGAHGSVLYDGTNFIEIPATSVKMLSSLGAGDTYAGAFLYAMTQGRSFAAAGQLASEAGAQVVAQYGPRLTQEQLHGLRG